jgi:hypothetical protein
MDPEKRSYRSVLNKAQQWLAYDCTPEAGDQRERIAVALRSVQLGNITDSTRATVEMARAVIKGGAL